MMRNNLMILFLFMFSLFFPQNTFKYKVVNTDLKHLIGITDRERIEVRNQYFSKAKDLTEFLPVHYDKTGNTDYTIYLQKGIEEYRNVIFPDFPVLVKPQGLQLQSNSKILFQKKSQLRVQPNDKEFYAALNLENLENVDIYFANLLGERYQHLNKKGEWGMGIYIVHSKNICVQKPTITEFWGDGIYIGKLEGITSNNIKVYGAFIDDNRRNGISIIAGDKIEILNSIISNTNGASPEYGIDIEPNKSADYLNDIILSNNTTFNNSKGGLLFALDNLQGKDSKAVNIQIINHTDYFSEKGIEFHIDRGYQKYLNPIKGTITIAGANLFFNKISIASNDSKVAAIKLSLQNIKNNNVKLNAVKINNFVRKFEKGKPEMIQ